MFTLRPYPLAVAAAVALACIATAPTYAACTNPAGNEADLLYSKDYHTYQFCNGTSWLNAGTVQSPDTIAGALTFGDTNVETGGGSGAANLLLAQQATLSHISTVSSLSFYVDTAAGNLVLGIYDAGGPGGGPGALQGTTAGFAPSAGWNTVNLVTPVTLTPGTYWLAFLPSSNSLVVEGVASGTADYYSYPYGSLPSTFSGSPSTETRQWSFYATGTAGCGSPQGNEGDQIYNSAYHTWQFCNGANWIAMELVVSGGGGTGCANPAGREADRIYNQDYHTWQFCDGTNWRPFGGASWIAPPDASSGYFVVSKTTWNGNLGGSIAAADAVCLSELTANTGWKGYAQANANGQLTSGKVHAWLCAEGGDPNATNCNNLSGGTNYYFADASNSSHGGNRFTTDADGQGPNNGPGASIPDWSQASYFGGLYTYWTGGRGECALDHNNCGSNDDWSPDLWSSGTDCSDWSSSASGGAGGQGVVGQTHVLDGFGSFAPEFGGEFTEDYVNCNNAQHLICYVNP